MTPRAPDALRASGRTWFEGPAPSIQSPGVEDRLGAGVPPESREGEAEGHREATQGSACASCLPPQGLDLGPLCPRSSWAPRPPSNPHRTGSELAAAGIPAWQLLEDHWLPGSPPGGFLSFLAIEGEQPYTVLGLGLPGTPTQESTIPPRTVP